MSTAVVFPIVGYLFTYWHTKVAEERKARIERVNEQLRELYGPLLACVTATESAYDALISSTSLSGDAQAHKDAVQIDPHGQAAESYRRWMTNVLQPLNERAAEIIVSRIDLLESDSISHLLLQLVAHVSANRVVLNRWEDGDLSAWSSLPYPDKLPDYVRKQFALMKQRQATLLGVQLQSKL